MGLEQGHGRRQLSALLSRAELLPLQLLLLLQKLRLRLQQLRAGTRAAKARARPRASQLPRAALPPVAGGAALARPNSCSRQRVKALHYAYQRDIKSTYARLPEHSTSPVVFCWQRFAPLAHRPPLRARRLPRL